MTRKTHIALGIAATLPIMANNNIPLIYIAGPIAASTAPDWDIYFTCIKHRTWTHSLITLSLVTIILSMIDPTLSMLCFIAYSLHLLADSFTKTGVPLFYPFIKKKYGPKLFLTSGGIDILVGALALAYAVCYFFRSDFIYLL